MTEPTADEADVIEQNIPAPEGEDDDGSLVNEVNPADAAEQSYDIVEPNDIDDEHPHDVDDRAGHTG